MPVLALRSITLYTENESTPMMTAIRTRILWMGWFGFNAGSALEATGSAGRCVPDDALDTFGVHCIGGILGSLGTGFFRQPALWRHRRL